MIGMAMQKRIKKKKKDKKNAEAEFFAAEDEIEGGEQMEQYFDEETGEMKFRAKVKTTTDDAGLAAGDKSPSVEANGIGKAKKKKDVAEDYTEEEWLSWEAEKKLKKEAKKKKSNVDQGGEAA